MTKDRRQVAADYVAALTEREYAEFIATSREHQADRGKSAELRDYSANLFRPHPTAWDVAATFKTNTEETQA